MQQDEITTQTSLQVASSQEKTLHPSSEQTLASEISQSGIGLHSGVKTNVKVLPAAPGEGRLFVRVDLPQQPIIPATVEQVTQTVLSTQLGIGKVCVRTVEHLLAALAGMGVDNARIEIDGAEVPLLDGSARLWVEAIAQVGLQSQSVSLARGKSRYLHLEQPIYVSDGDAFVAALPSAQTRFTYGIDFAESAIGNQWHSWSLGEAFAVSIAPARTFGLAAQVDALRQQGLIKGGTLDNALVCSSEGWLNPPLRFANEPARHKILDLVGDLSLLGIIPSAHFFAYKASHSLHIQLAQKIKKLSLKLTKFPHVNLD